MSNRPIPWFEKMAMAKGKYFELCVRSQKHYRAPEWSRTIDLQNRNLSLYPAELRAHGICGHSYARLQRQ